MRICRLLLEAKRTESEKCATLMSQHIQRPEILFKDVPTEPAILDKIREPGQYSPVKVEIMNRGELCV